MSVQGDLIPLIDVITLSPTAITAAQELCDSHKMSPEMLDYVRYRVAANWRATSIIPQVVCGEFVTQVVRCGNATLLRAMVDADVSVVSSPPPGDGGVVIPLPVSTTSLPISEFLASEMRSCVFLAAVYDHPDILSILSPPGVWTMADVAAQAACRGCLAALRWFFNHGCKCTSDIAAAAALCHNIAVLRLCIVQTTCCLTATVVENACRVGAIETLHMLTAEHPHLIQDTILLAIACRFGHIPIVEWLVCDRSIATVTDSCIDDAASHGRTDLLRFMYARLGVRFVRPTTSFLAITSGSRQAAEFVLSSSSE